MSDWSETTPISFTKSIVWKWLPLLPVLNWVAFFNSFSTLSVTIKLYEAFTIITIFRYLHLFHYFPRDNLNRPLYHGQHLKAIRFQCYSHITEKTEKHTFIFYRNDQVGTRYLCKVNYFSFNVTINHRLNCKH